MNSPGNFLILDPETTKLLQILAKLHPHGNRRVLRILLKFYIRLAKHARGKNLDPLTLLQEMAGTFTSKDFSDVELKEIERIDRMMDEVEGGKAAPGPSSGDLGELKRMIQEMQKSSAPRSRSAEPLESFSPKEAAKLVKIKPSQKTKDAKDYRKLRKQAQPRKIVF